MKKFWVSTIFLGLFAAGCARDEGPDQATPERPDTVREFTLQERAVANASNHFAFELLGEANAAESSKPNLLLSPLSVSMALGMALNGAAGSTFTAMRETLGFGTLSQAEVNAAYEGLIRQLRARDAKVEFGLANSIWYNQGFPVYAMFVDTVHHYFDAEVRALDFRSASAPQTISKWAEAETGGRIKDLIKQIADYEVMFLVNAVYFKAPWSVPFDKGATASAPFTRRDGSQTNVPMMSHDGSYPWAVSAEGSAVELLYGDSAFSMVLWLPAAGVSLNSAASSMTDARWTALLTGLRSQRVLLRMPKFRFDYEAELKDMLTTLGMGIAFRPGESNFTRIADRTDIFLSRVTHKSFIDVHELGTEAAAATAVGVGITSMPPTLSFDRPFFFVIRERSSGAVLFAGRVSDPNS